MSLSLALRWKWGRRRNTGCPSGVGVAKEESLMGKGSKNAKIEKENKKEGRTE